MSRPVPALPVSPKLFRHFAMITIGLTAVVALFADGESSEMIEDQIAQQQQHAAMAAAQAKQRGSKQVTLRDARRTVLPYKQASFDQGGEFGAPMTAASADGGGDGNAGATDDAHRPSRPQRPSLPMNGGSGQEIRPAATATKAPSGKRYVGQGGQPSADQLEAIEAASRKRSGR